MISAHRPIARPLGEVQAESGDRLLLDESTRKYDLGVERRGELERRLGQVSFFLDLLQKRSGEELSEGDRKVLDDDVASSLRNKGELEAQILEVAEELDVEEKKIEELKAAIAEDEEKNLQSSVWMVNSLGVPRPMRRIVPEQEQDKDKAEEKAESESGRERPEGEDEGEEEEEEELEEEEEEEDEPEVTLNNPEGICVEESGTVLVTDTIRSCIRRISSKGKVHALAGAGVPGHVDGELADAEFRHPRGICLLGSQAEEDGGRRVAICDTENHCVRLLWGEEVTTIAGVPGERGHKDGGGDEALFNMPWAACSIDQGTGLLVCDAENHCVRRIDNIGGEGGPSVTTVLGVPGEGGGGKRNLRFPWSVCVFEKQILVGDKLNQRLVMAPEGSQAGDEAVAVSDWWGEGQKFSPRGLVAEGWNNIYMTHSWQSQIYRLTKGEDSRLSVLDRIAGTGLPSHRDGKGELCEFFCPAGVGLDANGAVYVADAGNHCVRKCRELRSEEVKQKLAKFVKDLNNRGMLMCFFKWRDSVEVVEPLEPLDVVMALAMSTHMRLGEESDWLRLGLMPNGSELLQRIVGHVAKQLGWRMVRTKQEVQAEASLGEDSLGEEDAAERLEEARKAFELYDADGGGTIDASELMEALAAADMEVTSEEAKEMIMQYDKTGKGEIMFHDFCLMLGVEAPGAEEGQDGEQGEGGQEGVAEGEQEGGAGGVKSSGAEDVNLEGSGDGDQQEGGEGSGGG